MDYEAAIIGGGVVGCAIARELSQYEIRTVLIEKELEVGAGTSKANTGLIHSGLNVQAGTWRGKLNLQANPMFDSICQELDIPFQRIGSLVVAFNQEEERELKKAMERGKAQGVDLRWWHGDKVRAQEPHLNTEIVGAAYAPAGGIICPFELTLALAQNAQINGVDFLLGSCCQGLKPDGEKIDIKTSRGMIKADFVINAAGLYGDEIARTALDYSFTITPRRGQYYIYDKEMDLQINHTIFPMPTRRSKGIIITPTVHKNLMIGPNVEDLGEKNCLDTTEEGLEEVFKGASKLVPGLSKEGIIKEFAGNRAVAGDDFFIDVSPVMKGLIHVAGIQSPGLTAAPAIAMVVSQILRDQGLKMEKKSGYERGRPKVVRFSKLTYEEKNQLINKDPAYGHIICRCEMVSEGEVRDAISGVLGAITLDGIKRRTRAASGRCQSGFCNPRLLGLLKKYGELNPLKISWSGPGSEIVRAYSKDYLLQGDKR